jgi:hypothetical protein
MSNVSSFPRGASFFGVTSLDSEKKNTSLAGKDKILSSENLNYKQIIRILEIGILITIQLTYNRFQQLFRVSFGLASVSTLQGIYHLIYFSVDTAGV